MTVYGIDISNYQAGLDLGEVRREGFDFVFAKVSEGDYFVDASWPGFRDAARANDLILAGYHYVTQDDAGAQARTLMGHLGDPSIPLMLDFEAGSGDIRNYWAVASAVTSAGGRIALAYIPQWYWRQIGSPDLSAVPSLVASRYVSGTGYASVLYPGDQSDFWSGYGGKQVDILQFTDSAQVAGQRLDADAYRGTPDELRALLADPTGEEMTPEQARQLQDIWIQLLGPEGRGWPQLGNRTLVDALAVVLTQLTGKDPAAFAGWPQTGNRTDTDLLAAIAAALKVPGAYDPKH